MQPWAGASPMAMGSLEEGVEALGLGKEGTEGGLVHSEWPRECSWDFSCDCRSWGCWGGPIGRGQRVVGPLIKLWDCTPPMSSAAHVSQVIR